MATMIVKHRVADFANWKKVFDEMEGVRREHGWTGYEIYRDATDPNVVTIVNHMRDLAGAKQYGGSPALREAMGRAGVQGPPEIAFLAEAETRSY